MVKLRSTLHGLHVKDAASVFAEFVAPIVPTGITVRVVTGQGIHSKEKGYSELREEARRVAKTHGFEATLTTGGVEVSFVEGLDSSVEEDAVSDPAAASSSAPAVTEEQRERAEAGIRRLADRWRRVEFERRSQDVKDVDKNRRARLGPEASAKEARIHSASKLMEDHAYRIDERWVAYHKDIMKGGGTAISNQLDSEEARRDVAEASLYDGRRDQGGRGYRGSQNRGGAMVTNEDAHIRETHWRQTGWRRTRQVHDHDDLSGGMATGVQGWWRPRPLRRPHAS